MLKDIVKIRETYFFNFSIIKMHQKRVKYEKLLYKVEQRNSRHQNIVPILFHKFLKSIVFVSIILIVSICVYTKHKMLYVKGILFFFH